MKAINNISAGLAGAVVLNILHESAKRFFPNAPRVDLVGEEALSGILESAGIEPPKGNALYAATLAADVVSNALYYSLIGAGKKENVLLRGAGIGLAAGIGALTLTKPLGLNDAPVNRTNTTKALTVAWYLVGGLVTALVIKGTNK
ncbi:hypothetical protein FEM33_06900 [Dyadobacter flavalbus]|uniref:Uncharacterized protein n=1 Tax=Dyadobacter flavalbus TaxID=2579942 RepID=A0A5M8QVN8_9BACT|nr:hypothetical protein [Dyadobacter flavalbus]KAA6440327.1 hypothetical protein FEM33_06900 [Dyadobacter flavalbus]